MATKSKLEQAVEKKAASFDDAQREIALSQLSSFKQNKQRIADLKSQISVIDATKTNTVDEVRLKQSQRASIAFEKGQLEVANSKIAADLFNMMNGE